MSERRYWHKKWQWNENKTRLIHDSGLQFERINGAWQHLASTYPLFIESEAARGVPAWQFKGRLIQLTKEAERWSSNPRNNK